jgi:hypothetical protein
MDQGDFTILVALRKIARSSLPHAEELISHGQ